MKKLLLLLICFPIIGFGQDDCGEKPKYNGDKFGNYRISKEYKDYKKEVTKWNECVNANLIDGPCLYSINEYDNFLKINKKQTQEVVIYNWFIRIALALAKFDDNKYLVLNYSNNARNMYCKGDKLFLLSHDNQSIEFPLFSEAGKECSHGTTSDLFVGSTSTVTNYKLMYLLSKDKLDELKDFNLKAIRIYNSNGSYNEHNVAEKALHMGGIGKKRFTTRLQVIQNMFSETKLNCLN